MVEYDYLSSKKLVQDLGIIDVFKHITKEINKRNPKGDFLLIRNKMLGLPSDSKKQFFVFQKFVLTESSTKYEYCISIDSKLLVKSLVSVQCLCSCYFLDCHNLSFKIYQGWRNEMVGMYLPCEDTYKEMTQRVINFILNRPNI